jgi:iron(III) transport system permease protein
MMENDLPARDPAPTAARLRLSVWSTGAVMVAAVVLLPIATVLLRVFEPSGGTWAHLASTVLPGYIANSLMLVAGVVALAVSIGTVAGWLVAACEFPGRRVFEWALMLPMTMPAYVIAYVYFDRLSYWGPFQRGLRDAFGWGRDDYWFPEVASLPGAAVLMALVLYPYVYLLARAVFLRQSVHLMEAARALGASPLAAFLRVALPMARPAIVAGAAFVAMEVLADYGTVLHLGVPTLTVGIFRTWFASGAPVAASQLSALLLAFVAAALMTERWGRGSRRFDGDSGGRAGVIGRRRLGGGWAALACLACALPVLLGFAFPAAELVRLSLLVGDPFWGPRFFAYATNSLTLAAITAVLLVGIGVFLGYARRLDGGPVIRAALHLAGLGYAVPGAVIAIGVLVPLAALDNAVDAWMWASLGISTGLLLTGTMAALLFAYVVRFLAVALSTIEAGLARIPPSLDNAARSLGMAQGRALLAVHLPLLRSSLLSAAIFVFADVMKELPATLLVRPFNLDTLAIRTFRLAADGRLDEASTSALCIVAVGIVPVILLSRAMNERSAPRTPEKSQFLQT